jgi:hypothetical protein
MTIDRIRIYEGKPQVYGTHYEWDDSGEMSPVFLENPEKVDERRSDMDLPPLAKNIKRIQEETRKENRQPPADIRAYRKKLKIGINWQDGDKCCRHRPYYQTSCCFKH